MWGQLCAGEGGADLACVSKSVSPITYTVRGRVRAAVLLGVVMMGSACHSPTRPSSTVVAARPESPSAETVSYYEQPIRVLVTPAVAVSGSPVTSAIEVAKDSTFETIVMRKPVPPGGDGPLPDGARLPRRLDHVLLARHDTASERRVHMSRTSTLVVGPRLMISPPQPLSPAMATWTSKRPTFVVQNAERIGPPASVVYEIEMSRTGDFSTTAVRESVSEGVDRTSLQPAAPLPGSGQYFWRVKASAPSLGEASDYSMPQAFRVVGLQAASYRLALDLPSPCNAHQKTLESSLADSGDAFTFVAAGTHGDVRLQFSVAPAGTIEGTIRSYRMRFSPWSGTYPNLVTLSTMPGYVSAQGGPPASPIPLAGELSADGTSVRGTFDGYLSVDNVDYGWECDRDLAVPPIRHFVWSLVPR